MGSVNNHMRWLIAGVLVLSFLAATPVFAQQNDKPVEGVQTQTIQVNNATLTYIEQGNGEPVVLVHGSLGDYRSWATQVKPFSEQYNVIAYSRRYHYPNPWPGDSAGFSVAVHANDLAAFIRALDLEPVHLVGHSFGAFTSLLVARDHPQLVRSLTLGEPPVMPLVAGSSPGDSLLREFRENSIIPAHQAFEKGNTLEGIRRFINGVLGKEEFQNLPPETHAQMMDNAREMKGEMQTFAVDQNLFPPFSCQDGKQVKVPTLLVDGELSPPLMGVISDTLERCLPNTERVTIPSASHGLQFANPTAFNKMVLAFIAKN